MTKIKLYTEEQVLEIIANINRDVNVSSQELLEGIEVDHIKLPSDEEISEESMDLYWGDGNSLNHILQYKAFKRGAYWMRDKIQGSGQ
jgi:hypothetical protein